MADSVTFLVSLNGKEGSRVYMQRRLCTFLPAERDIIELFPFGEDGPSMATSKVRFRRLNPRDEWTLRLEPFLVFDTKAEAEDTEGYIGNIWVNETWGVISNLLYQNGWRQQDA